MLLRRYSRGKTRKRGQGELMLISEEDHPELTSTQQSLLAEDAGHRQPFFDFWLDALPGRGRAWGLCGWAWAASGTKRLKTR